MLEFSCQVLIVTKALYIVALDKGIGSDILRGYTKRRLERLFEKKKENTALEAMFLRDLFAALCAYLVLRFSWRST